MSVLSYPADTPEALADLGKDMTNREYELREELWECAADQLSTIKEHLPSAGTSHIAVRPKD